MTAGVLEGAAAGVAAVGTLYGLSVPVRRWGRRQRARVDRYRQEHDGRPAVLDPATGNIVEPAKPGMASTVEGISTRQQHILNRIEQIHAVVTNTTEAGEAFQVAVDEIRVGMASIVDKLEKQAAENERRHAENRASNAETRADVARLETAVTQIGQQATDAAREAKDAAGHAARLDRQQQEMTHQQHELGVAMEQRFSEHQVIEQAYVRALAELGVPIEVPAKP